MRAALLSLCLLLAVGCIDERRPPVPSSTSPDAAGCVISGTSSLAGAMLSLGSGADALLFAAVPSRSELVIDVTRVEPGAPRGIQVVIHTPLEGAGLRIQGWIARADLSFRTKKKLAIGPLSLDEGASVRVAAVQGRRVRVAPGDGGLDGAEVEVACDTLTVGEASVERPAPARAPLDASWLHQRARTKARLFAEPRNDAPAVGEVDARASLLLREGGDGWSQVLPANDTLRRYDPRKNAPAGQPLGFWARTAELR